jgi:small subunit ribosomal protein S1
MSEENKNVNPEELGNESPAEENKPKANETVHSDNESVEIDVSAEFKKKDESDTTSEPDEQESVDTSDIVPDNDPVIDPVAETQPENAAADTVVEVVEEEVAIEDVTAISGDKKPKDAFSAQVPGDFDWDSVGKKQDAYSDSERKRLESIYDETLKSIGEGEVIDGTVVSINTREVVVNIGFKSDGVIPAGEIRYNPNFKPGDIIEVYVESQEDISGQLVLSHKKARTLRSWERINQAMDNDEVINGFVKCRTKGGLIVDVFGIEAFLPGSQIDVKPIRDYDIYVGKTMEFKVVKINHEYKNVVVSHKALIEAELEIQKAEIISKLEKGQILEGTVKNITSYGVFVDLGGVDGLIHITDLSWGRINHPEEIVKLDEKINVVILDFDDNKKRIALGLKQLTSHPWDSLDASMKVGDNVKGKVVVIADYGAFIEIAPGVEGLIHVSEMSWSQHLRTAQDFLKVGDEVEAVILTLDREDRKMSLGIKQLIPDPWENIHEKYPSNSKHTATVRNFTNFGIFVELEEGVDGLIHISDLSWSKKIKHPAEFTKIGESIDVVVLDVDKENRRLSLGHKQLEENPWDVFETVFTIESVHQGTIVGTSDKGVIVSLPYGVEGFAPTRHIVKEDGSPAKMDETLDFKVIEFNKESKKIVVSHTKVYQDSKASEQQTESSDRKTREKTSASKAVKKMKDSIEITTLGDIDVLANLKSEIEKSEKSERTAKLEKFEKQQRDKDEAVKKKKEVEEAEAKAEAETETEEKPEKDAEVVVEKKTDAVTDKKSAGESKADTEKVVEDSEGGEAEAKADKKDGSEEEAEKPKAAAKATKAKAEKKETKPKAAKKEKAAKKDDNQEEEAAPES